MRTPIFYLTKYLGTKVWVHNEGMCEIIDTFLPPWGQQCPFYLALQLRDNKLIVIYDNDTMQKPTLWKRTKKFDVI